MTPQWPVELGRRTRVAESPERVIAVKMPAAVSDRLDSLVDKLEIVETVGGEQVARRGTSRKELLAALVYDAPNNRRELNDKLERYRRAQVGSVVLRPKTGDQIVLPGHRPGPRPTSLDRAG
jgi:hypothetical protein